MTLIPLPAMDGKQRRAALQFVVRHERCCVQLAAALRRSLANAYAAVFVRENGERRLYGVLNIKGTALHCLPYAGRSDGLAEEAAEDFIRMFAHFAADPKNNFAAAGVNGTASGTALILKALERASRLPFQLNRYHLICLDASDFIDVPLPPFANGEKVVRCRKNMGAKEFKKLYELQKQYELAEVLPKGNEFSEASCRIRLEYALKMQHIVAVQCADGAFAAKAGTNAIGFHFVQLGGVFTDPVYRRRHYARHLLHSILQTAFRNKKAAALFVKTANIPAIKLYESLGFRKIQDYTIAYFK